MFSQKGWLIIFLLLLFSIAESTLIFNNILVVNLFYLLIQNLVFSFSVTPLLVDNMEMSIHQMPQLKWMVTGVIAGFLPTTTMLITPIINFIREGNGRVSVNNGIVPFTIQTVLIVLLGTILVWGFQILVSAFAGLCARYLFDRSSKNRK